MQILNRLNYFFWLALTVCVAAAHSGINLGIEQPCIQALGSFQVVNR